MKKFLLIYTSYIIYDEVGITDTTYIAAVQVWKQRLSLTLFSEKAMKFDSADDAIKWRDKNVNAKINPHHLIGVILL